MKLIDLKNKTNRISKQLWALIFIAIVGIFLRTYNFHDWLRFNADQGRDAEVVSAFLSGAETLPLLGPKAGGTEFKLGPVFYYFQIIAAKIFGDAPDKMAYPDLLTGILCIPLLYFFLKKYFDQKIALALTAIFAVSNYAIRYARFAWNPNSTPFWTLLALFALHEVISEKQKRKYLWASIAGVAIGVGVQLHTTLLLFLPITTIIFLGYFALKNKTVLKYFLVILTMSLFLNVPQLVGEYQTGGENVKAFFGGVETKQGKNHSLMQKIQRNSSCWVQGNLDILSGYEISDTCSFKPAKHRGDLVVFVFGVLCVVGGLILAVRNFRKEKDADKKVFLGLVYVFVSVAFLIFVPIAFELSVRFYLALIFVPFLLLGFWLQFFQEKFASKHFLVILMVVTVALVCTNLFFVRKSFDLLASYAKNGGTVDVTLLGEAEKFANFIVDNVDDKSKVYIDGNAKFMFKAYKPLRYLVAKSNIDLVLITKNNQPSDQYFYVARGAKKNELLKDSEITVLQHKTFGKFTILLISQ